MKFTDIRYLRTEKLIFDAFAKLLSENPYEKITVQDIADEAMINRATFMLTMLIKMNFNKVFKNKFCSKCLT